MYDVVVIGGGAAGLNAALVLARARRRVLVVDGGEPRNAPAEHLHGFLSRDGMSPAELLAVGRREVLGYGAEIRSGTVESVEAVADGFAVRIDGADVPAHRLVVATGLRDELPELPGVRELWGTDVHLCPYCHGYEVRDQPLGVLATGPMAVHQALLLSQWSSDVLLFTDDRELAGEDRAKLAARGVEIVEGTVTGLVVETGRLRGVALGDREVRRTAVFLGSTMVPNDDVLTTLGCVRGDNGFVPVDATGRTAVAGVWAAGNVVDPTASLINAASAGSRAAMMINMDLIEEDVLSASLAR
jgi:thioredoxin reductase